MKKLEKNKLINEFNYRKAIVDEEKRKKEDDNKLIKKFKELVKM